MNIVVKERKTHVAWTQEGLIEYGLIRCPFQMHLAILTTNKTYLAILLYLFLNDNTLL